MKSMKWKGVSSDFGRGIKIMLLAESLLLKKAHNRPTLGLIDSMCILKRLF